MARKLLIPYFLWLSLLLLGPFLAILAVSFFSLGPLGELQPGFSLQNYADLADPIFLKTFLRTLCMALSTCALTLTLAYPLAYLVARLPSQKQAALLTLIMVPFWTNYLIRVLAYMDFLRLSGADLLFTPSGILGGLVYTYLPFALLPLYANLRTIDYAQLDAAVDLGANQLQLFRYILLPLSLPGIRNASLFVLVPCLGEYLLPELVGGGKFYMLGSLLQHQFLVARNWPLGAAIVMALVSLTLFFFACTRRRTQ